MTKNQKIALGCGGLGCLGLIVVVVVGVLIYVFGAGLTRSSRAYNFNVSENHDRNSNLNTDSNSNSSDNSNSNSTSTSEPSSTSSLSDDDRHRLYQAAAMTGDPELIRRVSVKLWLMNEDFTPGDDYVSFVKDHVAWAFRNGEFIRSLDTKEKAVAYVNEHFPD